MNYQTVVERMYSQVHNYWNNNEFFLCKLKAVSEVETLSFNLKGLTKLWH